MICANCQTENPNSAKFCLNCGEALALSCTNCGTELPADAKFCINCGQSVSKSGTSPATTSSSAAPLQNIESGTKVTEKNEMLQRYIPTELMSKLETARRDGAMLGERRIVTILFCDVKGSTSAASGLDPEEWGEIINGAFENMIQPVYRYEGTVARLMEMDCWPFLAHLSLMRMIRSGLSWLVWISSNPSIAIVYR